MTGPPHILQVHLPAVQSCHPTTFTERGVAVPFTTPLLAGTRARRSDRQVLELIVPNPSGARGVYILAAADITVLGRPTLHDRVLAERIAALPVLTPATVRHAAREVAAEGLAGEEAKKAAEIATDQHRRECLAINNLLLLALVERTGCAGPRGSTGNLSDVEVCAREAVAHIAPRLGRPARWIASALDALAVLMTETGVGAPGVDGCVSALILRVEATRARIAAWCQTRHGDDPAAWANAICAAAEPTLTMARTTLAQARALTEDVAVLLQTWADRADGLAQILARPAWLLDGWEPICLVWNSAGDDITRRLAVGEMMHRLPILPREAAEWCEDIRTTDVDVRARRSVRLNEDWRAGARSLEMIARNEQFRASMC